MKHALTVRGGTWTSVVLLTLSLALAVSAQERSIVPPVAVWKRMAPAERKQLDQEYETDLARQRAEVAQYFKDQKSGVCHVHASKMTHRTVLIQYGLPAPSASPSIAPDARLFFLASSFVFFPNSQETVEGGCVVSRDSPKEQGLYVCAACVDARRRFISELVETK